MKSALFVVDIITQGFIFFLYFFFIFLSVFFFIKKFGFISSFLKPCEFKIILAFSKGLYVLEFFGIIFFLDKKNFCNPYS